MNTSHHDNDITVSINARRCQAGLFFPSIISCSLLIFSFDCTPVFIFVAWIIDDRMSQKCKERKKKAHLYVTQSGPKGLLTNTINLFADWNDVQ